MKIFKNFENRKQARKHGKKLFYCKALDRVFFAENFEQAASKFTGYTVSSNPPSFKKWKYLLGL